MRPHAVHVSVAGSDSPRRGSGTSFRPCSAAPDPRRTDRAHCWSPAEDQTNGRAPTCSIHRRLKAVYRVALGWGGDQLCVPLSFDDPMLISFAMSRLLSALRFDVEPTDVVTPCGVGALTLVVPSLASVVPAPASARIALAIALRSEA